MRSCLLIFVSGLLFLTACRRLPDIQGTGDPRVQGIWEEDAQPGQDVRSVSSHHFKFSCDSFYLKLSVDARINYFSDTCATDGKRIEYAKGVYAVKNDTLLLSGVYTKPNYKQKISGCFNIGRYRHNFLIVENNAQRLVIRDLSNNQTSELRLQAAIACIPQPI